MILFKISRGLEENLPTDIVSGNCWFCIDTSNFYIDYTDTDGNLVRSKISGKYEPLSVVLYYNIVNAKNNFTFTIIIFLFYCISYRLIVNEKYIFRLLYTL